MKNAVGEAWRTLVARAADRPFYLASVIQPYKEMHGLDDRGLATLLGSTPENLMRLGLCRKPGSASAHFRQEVEQVAAYAGAQPAALAAVIRDAEASRALQSDSTSDGGCERTNTLLAARDKPAGPKLPSDRDGKPR